MHAIRTNNAGTHFAQVARCAIHAWKPRSTSSGGACSKSGCAISIPAGGRPFLGAIVRSPPASVTASRTSNAGTHRANNAGTRRASNAGTLKPADSLS